MVNGILPYATAQTLGAGTQYDFATTVPAGQTVLPSSPTTKRRSPPPVRPTRFGLTGNESLTTNKVVNAILFRRHQPGGSITITENNFTLGVTSGAIDAMGSNTLTISGGTVDFGSAEGNS